MKKPIPQFRAEIKKGKIEIEQRVAFNAYLKKLIGKKIYLIVKPISKIRSLNQNNYYWGGVLTPISEHTGHSIEDLHELFKEMFLGRQEITWRGMKKNILTTTTSKNTSEFSEYTSKIISEVADMGIRIASPEEYYDNFSQE